MTRRPYHTVSVILEPFLLSYNFQTRGKNPCTCFLVLDCIEGLSVVCVARGGGTVYIQGCK